MKEGVRDLVVIGGGSAGHQAAATGAELGLEVTLVEDAPELGGLCVLHGCMPSKTLIATANRRREIKDAADFALKCAEAEVDVEGLRQRVSDLVAEFQRSRVEEMEKAGYEIVRGRAAFLDSHRIEVTTRGGAVVEIESRAFVVATGSASFIPEIEGLRDTPFWTSDEVVRLPSLPKRLVVIGGGAIGTECAHLFEGLGAKVTMLVRGERILEALDEDLAASVAAAAAERGVVVRTETEARRVRHDGEVFKITLDDGDELEAEALLIATGRRPMLPHLRLDRAGVMVTDGRIVIDERTATSAAHIFAAGDCASPWQVVHMAVRQGEAAARNAARWIRGDRQESAMEWRPELKMLALFTAPEVAMAGATAAEARARGLDVREVRYDFCDQGKGMILAAKHGFAKLVIENGTDRLLGGGVVGPDAVDSIHILQVALDRGMTVDELLEVPFYHPTLAEIWTYVGDRDRRSGREKAQPT